MKPTQWILFTSGVISALLVSTAHQSPIVAQTAQSSQAIPSSQAVPSSQATQFTLLAQTSQPADELPQLSQTESAPPVREPMMTMPVSQGRVSVHLENMTAEAITYQALGDTGPRTLDANGDITLENLRVPTTVTFSYANMVRDRSTGSGLTKAAVRSEEDGMLHLVIQPTNDLDTEVSNLTVESNGNVFVF